MQTNPTTKLPTNIELQQILLGKENDAYQLLMFEYMKLPALHLMMSDKEFMPTIQRTNERTNNN